MKIINITRKTMIATHAQEANAVLSRMVGLLNKKFLSEGEGLVITQCQQIHMFFMQFSIDVIFVDKNNVVVGLVKEIHPFVISPIFWKAVKAIELPVSTIEKSNTQINDVLQMLPFS